MLFKTKLKLGLAISLLTMVFCGFYLYKYQSSNIEKEGTDIPKPVQQEKENVKIVLKAERGELLENFEALKGVTNKHGAIKVRGKTSVEKLEVASSGISMNELPEKVLGKDYDYVGVSITNTSDMRISSSTPENEEGIEKSEIVVMQNMGWSPGVDFRAQPVRSMAQKGMESQELKRLKEIQIKRKSNFAKALEGRRARKGLYDR